MLVQSTMKGLVRYGVHWLVSLGMVHPPKKARDMTPNMAYNPTLAFYTQPSGLESKCAYILE